MSLSSKVKKMFKNIAIGGAILGSSLALNSDIHVKQYYYDKVFSQNPVIEKKIETYEDKIQKIESLLDEIPTEGKDYNEEKLYNYIDEAAIVARKKIMDFYKVYEEELKKAKVARKEYEYFYNYKFVNNHGLDKFIENTYFLADFNQYTRDLLKRIELKIEEVSLFEEYHRDKLNTLILVYLYVPNKSLFNLEFKKQNAIIEYYSLVKDALNNLKQEILNNAAKVLHEF